MLKDVGVRFPPGVLKKVDNIVNLFVYDNSLTVDTLFILSIALSSPYNPHTMKHYFPLIFLLFVLSGCKKDHSTTSGTLNIMAVSNGSNKEFVKMELKSKRTTRSIADGYVFSSSVYDPITKGFGYVDLDSNFILMDMNTGTIIHQYPLPGFLTQTVIDPLDSVLIGTYYSNDTNRIVRLDLNTGAILSSAIVDFGSGLFACTYYYKPLEKEYVVFRADSSLITINPFTGHITKTVKMHSDLIYEMGYYNTETNQLIGLTYSMANNKNYVEVADVESGALISSAEIKNITSYFACSTGFDPATNCIVLVSENNDLLFIDIVTGELKDQYPLGFNAMEFKYWREQ